MPSKKAVKPRSASQASQSPKAPNAANQWEVVIVPFPFSTQLGNKRRPALVLSQRAFNQHGSTVLAMITTAGHHPWPGDVQLADLKAAGLNSPCLVRLKLFTLDNRLIVKKIGQLAAADRQQLSHQLKAYLPW
jgi:mRNA interferase MazF